MFKCKAGGYLIARRYHSSPFVSTIHKKEVITLSKPRQNRKPIVSTMHSGQEIGEYFIFSEVSCFHETVRAKHTLWSSSFELCSHGNWMVFYLCQLATIHLPMINEFAVFHRVKAKMVHLLHGMLPWYGGTCLASGSSVWTLRLNIRKGNVCQTASPSGARIRRARSANTHLPPTSRLGQTSSVSEGNKAHLLLSPVHRGLLKPTSTGRSGGRGFLTIQFLTWKIGRGKARNAIAMNWANRKTRKENHCFLNQNCSCPESTKRSRAGTTEGRNLTHSLLHVCPSVCLWNFIFRLACQGCSQTPSKLFCSQKTHNLFLKNQKWNQK